MAENIQCMFINVYKEKVFELGDEVKTRVTFNGWLSVHSQVVWHGHGLIRTSHFSRGLFSNVIGHLCVSGFQPVLLLASAPGTHALQLLRPYPLLPDPVSGNSPEHSQAALCARPDLHRTCPEGKNCQCGMSWNAHIHISVGLAGHLWWTVRNSRSRFISLGFGDVSENWLLSRFPLRS